MEGQTKPAYLTLEQAEIIESALGNYDNDWGYKDEEIGKMFQMWKIWMDCNFPDHNKPRK